MTSQEQRPSNRHSPIGRAEVWLLVALLAVGFFLRAGRISATAIEHFDEGVYASNQWFLTEEGGEYPGRYLYAPPLLPMLISTSMFVCGAGHVGTMLPVLLAGCATLPLVWCVARSWFGPSAGLAAVSLAAFSDFHMLYSRTALTDAMLCLWLLLSVFAIGNWLVTGTYRWAVLAGMATALAWSTKYNGWLPLAIGLAGGTAWLGVSRLGRTAEGKEPATKPTTRSSDPARTGSSMETTATPAAWSMLLRWSIVAAIAFLLWSPVLVGLKSKGGYAAVTANHRRYIVGPSGWVDGLVQQSASHRHLSGLSSCVGIAIAVALAVWASRPSSTWNRLVERPDGPESTTSRDNPPSRVSLPGLFFCISMAALLAGLAAIVGSAVLLAAMAAIGILLRLLPGLQRSRSGGTDLQTWLLAAWFFGLFAVTPMYWPYPRLTLPWLIASWLGTAALLGQLPARWRAWTTDGGKPAGPTAFAWIVATTCLAVGMGCMAASGTELIEKKLPAWQPRTGLETAAAQMAAEAATAASGLPRDPGVLVDFVIYVYGEPGLFFHLSRIADRDGNFAVQPASNLGFAQLAVPTYLAVGPHVLRSELFQRDWPSAGLRFRLIASYPDRASDLVLLNQYPAGQIANRRADRNQEVRLYLLK